MAKKKRVLGKIVRCPLRERYFVTTRPDLDYAEWQGESWEEAIRSFDRIRKDDPESYVALVRETVLRERENT